MRRWVMTGLMPAVVLLFHPAVAFALQGGASVTGRITVLERGDRATPDLGQAVIYLSGEPAPAGVPDTVEMATEGKKFLPRLVVVTRGSTVAFPNHDPFNHNVFSLSPEGPFDLGLYGRGEAKLLEFDRPGVIRVYCNVHAQMRGLVVVQETSLFTQPGSDGSFRLENVPPGEYVLHAWHERAAQEVTGPLRVEGHAVDAGTLTLDARGYRLVQHRDKEGKSYSDRSRRYRY